MDWIAPDDLNITTSWASFIREVVVMGIRGCGSSGLDWPVVTGWRAQTQQQVEARTHWNPISDLCLPPDLQSGDACIYPYGNCICVCSISFCDPCLGCLITKVLWAGCQDLQTRPNVLCPLHRCYTLSTGNVTVYTCIMVYTHVHCSMQYVSKLPGSPDHSNGLCQYWWLLSAGQVVTKIYIGNQTC